MAGIVNLEGLTKVKSTNTVAVAANLIKCRHGVRRVLGGDIDIKWREIFGHTCPRFVDTPLFFEAKRSAIAVDIVCGRNDVYITVPPLLEISVKVQEYYGRRIRQNMQ